LGYRSEMGGSMLASEMIVNHQEKAYALLQADAEKILKLIKVQMENLTMPQCPLYEEVLDTQMFGLSREIEFAVRLGLIEVKDGKAILDKLERELSALHEASLRKELKNSNNDDVLFEFFINLIFFQNIPIQKIGVM
jgi:uncharacterized protein YlaN (UPF0358 family)